MRTKIRLGTICKKHPKLRGERYLVNGTCVGCAAESQKKWGKNNPEKRSAMYKRYYQKHFYTGRDCRDAVRIGYIAELLVAADMNSRCGRAYPNPQPQTKDDVYAKTSLGWRTVQVKVGKLNRKTGVLSNNHRGDVSSDILAIVDIDNRRVRYESNGDVLPPELPEALAHICSTLVLFASEKEAAQFHSTSSTAASAKPRRRKSSASRKRKNNSAKRAVRNSRS